MDKFSDLPTTLVAPGRDAAPVVPDDLTDLPILPRALYVGQGGTVVVTMAGGQTIGFESVPGGTVLPVRARRVLASGTTATSIVALW